MVPALLLREIFIAVVGGAGAWWVGDTLPLQDRYRRVLQGGVWLTTVWLMGRLGGVW